MKPKPKIPAAEASSHPPVAHAVKLSINVTNEIGLRLRKVAFDERLSESSIVEIALELLFSKTNDADVGEFLREHGASLRRAGR